MGLPLSVCRLLLVVVVVIVSSSWMMMVLSDAGSGTCFNAVTPLNPIPLDGLFDSRTLNYNVTHNARTWFQFQVVDESIVYSIDFLDYEYVLYSMGTLAPLCLEYPYFSENVWSTKYYQTSSFHANASMPNTTMYFGVFSTSSNGAVASFTLRSSTYTPTPLGSSLKQVVPAYTTNQTSFVDITSLPPAPPMTSGYYALMFDITREPVSPGDNLCSVRFGSSNQFILPHTPAGFTPYLDNSFFFSDPSRTHTILSYSTREIYSALNLAISFNMDDGVSVCPPQTITVRAYFSSITSLRWNNPTSSSVPAGQYAVYAFASFGIQGFDLSANIVVLSDIVGQQQISVYKGPYRTQPENVVIMNLPTQFNNAGSLASQTKGEMVVSGGDNGWAYVRGSNSIRYRGSLNCKR
eukprot:TRINITY_DN1926_c0_g1_i1.p1 TRINITY_DN1926_c0_g1~~TRINITY_DN1926_c0_g1_i1.p1  ORF type:complete len:424 (+),score=63.95 TRINITY_DN1926_c0_g1_i1:51-1274(+)